MAIAAIIAAAEAEAAAAAAAAATATAAQTAAATAAAQTAATTATAGAGGLGAGAGALGSMTGTGAGLTTAMAPEALAMQSLTAPASMSGIMGGQGAMAPVEGIMQGAQAAAPVAESAGITQAAPEIGASVEGLPVGAFPGSSTPPANGIPTDIFSTPATPNAANLTQASGLHSGMDPSEIMRQQALSRGTGIQGITAQGGSAEAGAGSMKMGLEAGFEKALSFAKDNPMTTISGLQLLDRALAPGQPKRRAFNPGLSLSPNFKPTLAPSAPGGVYSRRMAEGGIASDAEQPDYEDNISRYAQGGIASYATGGITYAEKQAQLTSQLGRPPTAKEMYAASVAPVSQLTVAPSTTPATSATPATVSPVAAAAAKQVAASNPLMAAQTNPLMAAVNAEDTGSSGFNAMNYVNAKGEGIPWYQQTANVNLPDAKKAATIAGVTPGVAVKSQAEIDAAKPKTFDPANMPFSAMNYTDVKGAAIPWYQQTANANLPDAKKAAAIAGVTPGVAVKSQAEINALNAGIASGADTVGPPTPKGFVSTNPISTNVPAFTVSDTPVGTAPTTTTTTPATTTTTPATTFTGAPSTREDAMEAMRRSVYVPEYVDYTRTPLTPGIGTPTTLSYEAIQSQLGHAPTLKEIGTASAAFEANKPTTAAQYSAMSAKGEKGMARGGKTSDTNLFRALAAGGDEVTKADMDAITAYHQHAGDLAEDDDVDTRLLDPYSAAQVRLAKLSKKNKMEMAPVAKTNIDPANMAQGGITQNLGSYSDGGHLLKGPGDGMSDHIPAMIGKHQPARLADGEFVIPADVVSHLGNGSTEAGAKQLYAMMSRIRKARTGNPKQGKQVDPRKLMPK